jgi:hypothetical protein
MNAREAMIRAYETQYTVDLPRKTQRTLPGDQLVSPAVDAGGRRPRRESLRVIVTQTSLARKQALRDGRITGSNPSASV